MHSNSWLSFLKVVSLHGEPWIGFTSHFTLTNMTGSFSTDVSTAIKSMQPVELLPIPSANLHLDDAETRLSSNTSGLIDDLAEKTVKSILQFPAPSIINELGRNELRKRFEVDAHNIPYGEQTGLTKYAPMPKRAGSTIAEGSPTPQYPPFPFSIATTYLPAPTVQYTDTAYLTWTTHSIENTVGPANPQDIGFDTDPHSLDRLLPQLHPLWTRGCKCGWSAGRIEHGSPCNYNDISGCYIEFSCLRIVGTL